MRAALPACVLAVMVSSCGMYDAVSESPSESADFSSDFSPVAAPQVVNGPETTVADPGPLRGSLRSPDVLVIGDTALGDGLRDKIGAVPGVRAAEPLSVASVPVGERSVTVAAVDSDGYRRFTVKHTATADAVWQAIAAGDAVLSHEIGRDLNRPLGERLGLRAGEHDVDLRVGAYATTVPRIDVVVNERRGEQLGLRRHNAMVLALDDARRDGASAALTTLLGDRGSVQELTTDPAPSSGTRRAAYLTGGADSNSLGSFSYRYFEDGSVEPEASWVNANITTETVPILGSVTCHRVMLPQFRAAMREIVDSGLADRIDRADYGGCYVPRFIGRDPNRGLSLHTWGIAVDLNVSGNHRGTVGEIDRRVVRIFKKWGFAWGGDWEWTDPMHFELATIIR